MNYSNNTTNVTAAIHSPTQSKEMLPSILYPIMSTGINNSNHYFPTHVSSIDDTSTINSNNSTVMLAPTSSPPLVPKMSMISQQNRSSNGVSSSLSRLDENRQVGSQNKSSAARVEIFDSTSGREDWTEEGEIPTPTTGNMPDNDTTSQSTRLFSTSSSHGGTGAHSEASTELGNDIIIRDCAGNLDLILTVCLGIVAFVTPILMVILPLFTTMKTTQSSTSSYSPSPSSSTTSIQCSQTCESALVFLGTKLILLSIASLILFCRRRTHSFPRVLIFKLVLIVLLFVIIFAFWLFYVLRILLGPSIIYDSIVEFASNVTDVLIFTHYLTVLMLEVRHLETRFCIKVVRSPDGESRYYQMGNTSIQSAAVKILQSYVIDFSMHNIYCRSGHQSMRGSYKKGGKFSPTDSSVSRQFENEEIDSKTRQHQRKSRTQSPLSRSTRSFKQNESSIRNHRPPDTLPRLNYDNYGPQSMASGFRERIYRELELDKRLKKRRLRLLANAEEAFGGLRRVSDNSMLDKDYSIKLLSVQEAAQNLLAQLAKPFQKYLKLARLQSHYPKTRIQNHLTRCLQHGLSPQAFLDSLIASPRVIESSEFVEGQQWSISSNKQLYSGLSHNLTFILRRENVSLFCTVQHIPMFSLSEDIFDKNSQKFLIKFNSETSV